MTWEELGRLIAQLTPKQRKEHACLVQDLDGPDQRVDRLAMSVADRDIWHGFGIGSELALYEGEVFLVLERR